MRTNLDTRNKWEDTIILWQGKEREKMEENKKIHWSLIIAQLYTGWFLFFLNQFISILSLKLFFSMRLSQFYTYVCNLRVH